MCDFVSAHNTLNYCGRWSSIVGNFLCLQILDLCLSCGTCISITCITKIRICTFPNSGAFCILSNSVTRNEIMSIGAFTDDHRDHIVSYNLRTVRVVDRWNPIGRIFFGRPKISFEKFSSRPASYGICDIVPAPSRTLCCKSIQNGARCDTQHV